jgi:hypothetical protein
LRYLVRFGDCMIVTLHIGGFPPNVIPLGARR